MMAEINVCLSPALLPFTSLKNKVVVIIDIFRATTSICYGLENGALEIVPVATLEQCLSYVGKDYLLAAERDGQVVEGFDFGNSPFSYQAENVKGKRIVLTTTNGTQAIEMAKGEASAVLIGSFLNLTALCSHLKARGKDVLLLCAGWKNDFNLEDCLFAGAVVEQLQCVLNVASDSAQAALALWEAYKHNLPELLNKSSHTQRLKNLGIEKDVQFCLQQDICQMVPILINGVLRAS